MQFYNLLLKFQIQSLNYFRKYEILMLSCNNFYFLYNSKKIQT